MLLELLSEEQEDALLAEIGYTRKQLNLDLNHIKSWIEGQHHLPPSRLKEDDSFFTYYLTGCKGDLDKVKRKINSYYTLRSQSEIYDCRDPLDAEYMLLRHTFKVGALPKLMNEKLCRIAFSNCEEWKADKFDCLLLIRKVINLAELRLRKDKVATRNTLIIDMKGFGVRHLMKLNPLVLKDLIRVSLECVPFRYSFICLFNAPLYVKIAVNTLIVPFFPKKLKERVYITNGTYKELYNFFDRNHLPKDYDGTNATMKELSDAWSDEEIGKRDWYINELSEICDESKRIIQDPTDACYGDQGSSKKLVFD